MNHGLAQSPPRRILLSDSDAFFTQCARAADPEGAGRARLLIVGGSAEGRGVVTSASYEARAYGVRAGMPTAMAMRRCPGATVVPVPKDVVGRTSRAIFAVLARFTPVFEPASVDEAYLDLTGTEAVYGGESLEATARRVRRAVLDETGFSVSLGGGASKLVAKMAVEVAKPKPGTGATGVHVVPAGGEEGFMRRFALGDIPGVGPVLAERLARMGLRTVDDARAVDRVALEGLLGARGGGWLWERVRGIDARPVAARARAKSHSREDTFPRDVADEAVLMRELLRLTERVVDDLRADGFTARRVVVKLKSAEFAVRSGSQTLAEPVQTAAAVAPVVRALFARLRMGWRPPLRLVGVGLEVLAPTAERAAQLSIFDAVEGAAVDVARGRETERDRKLAGALDAIRAKYGRGSIGIALGTGGGPAAGRV